MNDFTNTSLMKSKYNIDINHEIIKLLLNYKANPYINNLHNVSPIHNILKNYNHSIFEELRNIGIDIDFYKNNNDKPKQFIKNEITNNKEKLFGNTNNQLNKILSNITEAHYHEFKALILNNPRFGNNFLRIFEDSFNITAYLTFYILSELLIVFEQTELRGRFPDAPDKQAIITPAFNSSHLFEQIGQDKMKPSKYIQLLNLLKIKQNELKKIKEKCIITKYNDIKNEILAIEKEMNNIPQSTAIDKNTNYLPEIYIEVWNHYLNNNNLNDRFNYNLIPLYLLDNRSKLLSQLDCFCQQYFSDKFANNNMLYYVYLNVLVPQTKLIICHSINLKFNVIITKF
jgi:hypothetical protein